MRLMPARGTPPVHARERPPRHRPPWRHRQPVHGRPGVAAAEHVEVVSAPLESLPIEEPESLSLTALQPPARGRANRLEIVVMFTVSLGLGLALFHRDLSNLFNSQLGGAGDADEYSWFLSWVPFAIGHGMDPLVTTYVNHPGGVNLMWNTSVLLPSLVMSPVTVAVGAAFSYNVLVTLAPVLSSTFAFAAFRRWTAAVPAALGALVFGFSPYVIAQSIGHLAQTLIMSAPLLMISLDRVLVAQSGSPLREGLLLGLLGWAQLLTGEEVLAMEVLSAVIAVAALCLLNLDRVRSHLPYALKGLGAAGCAFAILSVPFLAIQYFGPYRVEDVHPANAYVSDLFNFLVPTNLVQLAPASALRASAHFTGNGSEKDAYIGAPLLIFLVLALFLARRRRVAWVAAALAGGAAVLSMGPTLHVLGHVSSFELPDHWLAKLPVLHNLLPDRFASMTFLGAGLLVALGLHEMKRSRPILAFGGWALLGTGLVALVPTIHFPANASPIFTQFSSGSVCPRAGRVTDGGPPVALVVPSVDELDLRWQAEAKFCFAEASATGMTGTNAGDVPAQGVLLTLANPSLPALAEEPSAREEAAQEVAALQLKEIIVAPQSPAAPSWSFAEQRRAVTWLEWLLGQPPERTAGPYTAYVWRDLPPVAAIASGRVGLAGAGPA